MFGSISHDISIKTPTYSTNVGIPPEDKKYFQDGIDDVPPILLRLPTAVYLGASIRQKKGLLAIFITPTTTRWCPIVSSAGAINSSD